MLLTSVIIVIREVLEAALLISILLSLCFQLAIARKWFKWGVLGGIAGSVGLGSQLGRVSQLFDGIGQEVVDAGLQIFIYVCLLYICVQFINHYFKRQAPSGVLYAILIVIISCAMTREGSEIYIYLSAFQSTPEARLSLYSGAVIGFGIGFSCCALFYYWLLSFSLSRALVIGCALLTLVASGMMLQAGKMLIQADLLPDGQLWDSSSFLSEDSLAGQMLYALAGYEATPAPAQLILYGLGAVCMAAVILWRYHYWQQAKPSGSTN
ncbi:FTR1 family protein [Zhongshania sp.]|jgi:high-affinity iron transporter|uniref:FTR1 family protein n=1 Tax=Zhongshania sp. TaxID=1971902 RepID=UPI001B6730E8|nr:FTR1 family protein [Zhongshania sp.]MBQ0759034.1 FTR1 family protein [Zhongshania sp.]MBQ0794968.1 FTR1 family protein [Zhongshania sp.]